MNIAQLAKIRDIEQRKRIMHLLEKYERDPNRNVILDRVIQNMGMERKGEKHEQS